MELPEQRVRFSQSLKHWLGNVIGVFKTTINGLLITLRYWRKTYDPDRRTFTEHYEYPEKPVPVAPRYRGFHRFDLTTCIACMHVPKPVRWIVFTLVKKRYRWVRVLKLPATRSIIRSVCSVLSVSSLVQWIVFSWALLMT